MSSNTHSTKLYLDAQGTLMDASSLSKKPSHFSDIHQVKLSHYDLLSMLVLLSGKTRLEIKEYSFEIAVQWLTDHIGDGDDTEADVYRLLAHDVVIGWWRNSWLGLDATLLQELTAINKRHILLYKGEPDKYQRAQAAVWAYYQSVHAQCMNKDSELYSQLEASYCVLWKLIR